MSTLTDDQKAIVGVGGISIPAPTGVAIINLGHNDMEFQVQCRLYLKTSPHHLCHFVTSLKFISLMAFYESL